MPGGGECGGVWGVGVWHRGVESRHERGVSDTGREVRQRTWVSGTGTEGATRRLGGLGTDTGVRHFTVNKLRIVCRRGTERGGARTGTRERVLAIR
jgi:hypothetical protein